MLSNKLVSSKVKTTLSSLGTSPLCSASGETSTCTSGSSRIDMSPRRRISGQLNSAPTVALLRVMVSSGIGAPLGRSVRSVMR